MFLVAAQIEKEEVCNHTDNSDYIRPRLSYNAFAKSKISISRMKTEVSVLFFTRGVRATFHFSVNGTHLNLHD